MQIEFELIPSFDTGWESEQRIRQTLDRSASLVARLPRAHDWARARGVENLRINVVLDQYRTKPIAVRIKRTYAGLTAIVEIFTESWTERSLPQEFSAHWTIQTINACLDQLSVQHEFPWSVRLPIESDGSLRYPFLRFDMAGAVGQAGKSWARREELDLWLRLSRLVCDVITAELSALDQPVRSSKHVELLAASIPSSPLNVVKPDFLQLPIDQQVEQVLDFAKSALLDGSGCSLEDLLVVTSRAENYLRSSKYCYQLEGRWVQGHDSELDARWVYRVDGRGEGRLRLEILDGVTGLTRFSEWVPAGPTAKAVQTSADDDFLWVDNFKIEFARPQAMGKSRSVQLQWESTGTQALL